MTVTTKTFMRYKELKLLIRSLRQHYKDMTLIVADDTHEPEKIIEENVLHYIMPGGQVGLHTTTRGCCEFGAPAPPNPAHTLFPL